MSCISTARDLNIVLLGGSGFVGTRLSESLLSEGYNLIIGDISESDSYPELWQYCDIRNKKRIRNSN